MKILNLGILSLFILAACKKDDPPVPPELPGKYENGLLVLNEGLFQQNNASVCFYSLNEGKVYTQSFFTENGRGLGDTANDFVKYSLDGSEYILIVVDVSSQVEIVEANTLKSVAQIPLFDGTVAREPRSAEVYGSKAYVCNFDGTVSVIDLNSKSILTTIEVGANPDALVRVGAMLYVANSGGLNYPVYDSTMMVIDLNSNAVVDTFETRINSSSMILDAQNEIYLISSGNYADIGPAFLRISTTSNQVIQEWNEPVRAMTQGGDWIYYYDENLSAVKRFNTLTETFDTGILIDCSSFETFYGLHYEAGLNTLFCFDAKGYVNSSSVRAYEPSGAFKFEFTAALNAKKIIYNE